MSLQEEARQVEDAWQRARREAYGPAEFVDQHGFMRARDILVLAARAGIAAGTRVLDLCCGPGGPGRLVVQDLACDYLGVDASPAAVARARAQGESLGLRHDVLRVPPLPPGPFDVVLLLETLLAFRDKGTLLGQVGEVLVPGGRFALTAEVGMPLTPPERALMPAPDTVWPVPLAELLSLLDRAGLEVAWCEDVSAAHLGVVEALLAGFSGDGTRLAAQLGREVLEDMLTAHGLWRDWLRGGRVRKYALVARRPG